MVDSARRERAEPEAVGAPSRRSSSRVARNQAERGRRRRRFAGKIALAVFVVVVLAGVFVGGKLWHTLFGAGDDYSGSGKRDLVIQVQAGDSTTNIGETLRKEQVIKTVRAFVNAAHGNSAINSIQPGFYRMRTEIPAAFKASTTRGAQTRDPRASTSTRHSTPRFTARARAPMTSCPVGSSAKM